ncbi:MAG: hypothetical protein U9R05_00160 [Chloroflexota bacterium]|nr:hypothetical protein [Chloroflexota bacterium]
MKSNRDFQLTLWRSILPVVVLLLSALACSGTGLAYEHDLVKDYAIWAGDLKAQAAVVQKIPDSSSASTVVGPMVFAYGWNEAFIIAKQHPNPFGGAGIDTGVTHWFIVEVASEEVHGPLTETEYLELREQLAIPHALDFVKTIEP